MEAPTQLATDIWTVATWDEYIQTIENPAYEQAKGFYHNGRMLIDMAPIGFAHSCDHTIILFAVSLFCTLKGIPLKGQIGCSFRKLGLQECQPDCSYYVGERANLIPQLTKIVDLNTYPAPDLVIEISDSTLSSDLGNKRLMYEELVVKEYWIVDVQKAQLKAFTIANGGSQAIAKSTLLPGLSFSLLEEALQRTRVADQSTVGAWLMQQFQAI
ncbi:Uma2 family endonuclease [Aliterella atlantica]|uniref:Putative restriction endonuclease domain-containing protein n=1 Tax=Aliterella atlantica CENA595 TaxID=1618023 RepID=A0A0D8ZSR0_9CYAN|nr:Uma2 family endonuclease [Aliterella atlantica]KJH71798.1 hypothetical protein UH38_10440 [Aliterella atlantica CENA595]